MTSNENVQCFSVKEALMDGNVDYANNLISKGHSWMGHRIVEKDQFKFPKDPKNFAKMLATMLDLDLCVFDDFVVSDQIPLSFLFFISGAFNTTYSSKNASILKEKLDSHKFFNPNEKGVLIEKKEEEFYKVLIAEPENPNHPHDHNIFEIIFDKSDLLEFLESVYDQEFVFQYD